MVSPGTATAMTIVATIIGRMAIAASPIAATRAHPRLILQRRKRAADRVKARVINRASSAALKASRIKGPQGGERKENDRRERFERPARQAPREEAARDEQALPSFITAPVRPAPAAAETHVDDAEPVQTPREAGGAASAAPEAGAAAPRAKRGRPRRTVEPAADAEDGAPPSNDGTSPVGAK